MDNIELGPPGPFMAGVMAGIRASDAVDVPGETTFDQLSAFFWLHVGTSMASAGLVDLASQALFVEGAKTRAPSRENETPDAEGDAVDNAPTMETVIALSTAWGRSEKKAHPFTPLPEPAAHYCGTCGASQAGVQHTSGAMFADEARALLADPGKVAAVRIWLHRVEGRSEECTEHTFEGPRVWSQAHAQLFSWAYTAPDDGSYDKTDFRVTYANGEEYSGTFGLKRHDVDLPAHMRAHLEHLLAHPTTYAKFVDEARKFLDTCEIGPA